jgi:hypothetical protein
MPLVVIEYKQVQNEKRTKPKRLYTINDNADFNIGIHYLFGL